MRNTNDSRLSVAALVMGALASVGQDLIRLKDALKVGRGHRADNTRRRRGVNCGAGRKHPWCTKEPTLWWPEQVVQRPAFTWRVAPLRKARKNLSRVWTARHTMAQRKAAGR